MRRALHEDVQILRCPICSASEIDCSHSRAHGHLCAYVLCIIETSECRLQVHANQLMKKTSLSFYLVIIEL
jgi:hypothetical protein